jgi:hypothetical protein
MSCAHAFAARLSRGQAAGWIALPLLATIKSTSSIGGSFAEPSRVAKTREGRIDEKSA